ncbi:MAG: SDR family oxidoreductase [Bacteroidetes bacterium]|nr:SDR family oxidoreductase [Bacteroidota bacterium]
MKESTQTFPPQEQQLPGSEQKMQPKPVVDDPNHRPTGKLRDKIALITGGDSGIGKAVAILFAKEGAKVAINYLNEHEDAREAKDLIEKYGGEALLLPGDISSERFCRDMVDKVVRHYGRIDILVNNAAEQHQAKGLEEIETPNLIRTFQVNVFAMFFITQAALPHMGEHSAIINTTSVTAYKGSPELLDYSATKGAIVAFTRSLSGSLAEKNIRVNGVAPGPIWTPLIPASFDAERTKKHGANTPLERAGQPVEVAPCYLFLASKDASYMSGQVLHPNGGTVVNS